MNILIKDMEKPKFCHTVIDGEDRYCPFVDTDAYDCVLLLRKGISGETWREQYSKCPLVEVPEPYSKGATMNWGIAETAPEIEKIKAESADYLHGLESCGVIDWDTYNYTFDFYADLLMKAYNQGRKDAQSEPCEDAVSRKELLKFFSGNGEGSWTYDTAAIGYIKALPSVTPKRKTGRWINENDGKRNTVEVLKCSVCCEVDNRMYRTDNFCPNCGAMMEE